jgi:maleamate amidohydrolase
VVYEPGGADGGLFYLKLPALSVFDKGSAFGAFSAALQPNEGEIVISKRYAEVICQETALSLMRGDGRAE